MDHTLAELDEIRECEKEPVTFSLLSFVIMNLCNRSVSITCLSEKQLATEMPMRPTRNYAICERCWEKKESDTVSDALSLASSLCPMVIAIVSISCHSKPNMNPNPYSL